MASILSLAGYTHALAVAVADELNYAKRAPQHHVPYLPKPSEAARLAAIESADAKRLRKEAKRLKNAT